MTNNLTKKIVISEITLINMPNDNTKLEILSPKNLKTNLLINKMNKNNQTKIVNNIH